LSYRGIYLIIIILYFNLGKTKIPFFAIFFCLNMITFGFAPLLCRFQ